jgi:hypothetical protein
MLSEVQHDNVWEQQQDLIQKQSGQLEILQVSQDLTHIISLILLLLLLVNKTWLFACLFSF